MARYVAFLRGMNTGRRRVRNDDLCTCFEDLGLENVSAFLASGNVVFEAGSSSASRLEKTIEAGLESALGYEVKTFVRSAREVADIGGWQPFDGARLAKTTGNVQVLLLAKRPSAATSARVLELQTGEDRLAFEGRQLYWLPRGNLSASELDLRAVERALGGSTMRAQRTMLRLSAKLG